MTVLLILKAIIIGIVEGITEFLPISSTGHLIIIEHFINFQAPTYSKEYVDMFTIVIQLGAILSVVVLYWDKIYSSLKNLKPGKWGFKLWFNIIIAFIPAAILGLLTDNFREKYLMGPTTVTAALIVGGFLMIFIENKYRKKFITRNIDDINIKQSFMIGCFQCLSLWPGMSRSASTIMGAWIGGINSFAAAEFSFFLAIPTMIAASGYKLITADFGVITTPQIIALAVGFIVSFLVALVVVEKFMNFLKKKPMRVFAVYRIFIGIILCFLIVGKVLQ